tara:strand:- start:337 stop:555 length:219 start_codon:yes stop_codon:yes gene_type:complete
MKVKKKNKITLGQYLHTKIYKDTEVRIKIKNGEDITSELEFWIQQYKTGPPGHSEWSERYQRNFWVEDDWFD